MRNELKTVKLSRYNYGFTLIELSIVMVIIGLIIGGIMTGQSLIHGAGVRSTISQLKGYSTATNIFNMKYNALPGDFSAATNYIAGFTGVNGNNDGLIGAWAPNGGCATPYANCAPQLNMSVEYQNFWSMLTLTGLIEGNYGNGVAGPGGMILGTNFPATKMNSSVGYLAVGNVNDLINYFEVGITGIFTNFSDNANTFLTPDDAYAIDSKMDDGIANAGSVVARMPYLNVNGYQGGYSPIGTTCTKNA